MAPPLIALLFLIVVVAVVGLGALWAIRAGLWVRETRAAGDDVDTAGAGPSEPERRPEHQEVEDPAKQRYVGT
jgi:hypothetical protein